MALYRQKAEHIAKFTGPAMTEEEKVIYAEHFSSILRHFRKLQEADTSYITPRGYGHANPEHVPA